MFFFVNERYQVFWGGFNMVQATKALLEVCISVDEDYKRLILISGADYPLKTNIEIHDFFDNNMKVEFIGGYDVTQSGWKPGLNKIKHYFYFDLNIRNKIIYKFVKKFM